MELCPAQFVSSYPLAFHDAYLPCRYAAVIYFRWLESPFIIDSMSISPMFMSCRTRVMLCVLCLPQPHVPLHTRIDLSLIQLKPLLPTVSQLFRTSSSLLQFCKSWAFALLNRGLDLTQISFPPPVSHFFSLRTTYRLYLLSICLRRGNWTS